MDPFYSYAFLIGLYAGQYTNFFSKIVITSLVLYMVHPKVFTLNKFNPLYVNISNWTYPYISMIYDFNSDKKTEKILVTNNLPELEMLKLLPNIETLSSGNIVPIPTPRLKIIKPNK